MAKFLTQRHGKSTTKSHRITSLCLLGMILIFGIGEAEAQEEKNNSPTSWQIGLRSTGYFFESQTPEAHPPESTAQQEFQAFQTVAGSVSGLARGKLILRGSGRFANDLAIAPHEFQTGRWYCGYAEMRLNPKLRARLGRQYLASGVTGMTLDGAWASLRPNRVMTAAAWAGARAPVQGDFDLGDMSQDKAAGGTLTFRLQPGTRLGLSGAYRERFGKVAERPVGMELLTSRLPNTRLLTRASYDLEAHRWARIQVQARWQVAPQKPSVNLQLLDRHPSIDAASWFSRFTHLKRIQVARLSLAHTLASRFGGEMEFLGTYVGERTNTRLGLAVLFPLGRAGYSLQLGDAGEENQFFGEIRYQVLHWLQVDAQASVLTYALLEDAPAAEERDLVAMAAGFRADLRPGFRLIGQIQSLDNPYYSEDIRVVLGLDLSMARGKSNLGLGRGGWLQ